MLLVVTHELLEGASVMAQTRPTAAPQDVTVSIQSLIAIAGSAALVTRGVSVIACAPPMTMFCAVRQGP